MSTSQDNIPEVQEYSCTVFQTTNPSFTVNSLVNIAKKINIFFSFILQNWVLVAVALKY